MIETDAVDGVAKGGQFAGTENLLGVAVAIAGVDGHVIAGGVRNTNLDGIAVGDIERGGQHILTIVPDDKLIGAAGGEVAEEILISVDRVGCPSHVGRSAIFDVEIRGIIIIVYIIPRCDSMGCVDRIDHEVTEDAVGVGGKVANAKPAAGGAVDAFGANPQVVVYIALQGVDGHAVGIAENRVDALVDIIIDAPSHRIVGAGDSVPDNRGAAVGDVIDTGVFDLRAVRGALDMDVVEIHGTPTAGSISLTESQVAGVD